MVRLILDEEVFAVIMAITVIASIAGIAIVLKPDVTEPFIAIGLLNEECKVGEYPSTLYNSTHVDLCIYLVNYMGKPIYYRVVYKIGSRETLPTNTTPSSENDILSYPGLLDHGENKSFPVEIPVYTVDQLPREVALIFELWLYDTSIHKWIYSGRWVHLYVNVTFKLGDSA